MRINKRNTNDANTRITTPNAFGVNVISVQLENRSMKPVINAQRQPLQDKLRPGPIGEALINHLAFLSRLEPSAEEKKSLLGHLAEILEYVEKLKEVNTEQVEPLVHTQPMQNVFREDKVKEGLAREDVLANAPDKEAGHFKVPRVI